MDLMQEHYISLRTKYLTVHTQRKRCNISHTKDCKWKLTCFNFFFFFNKRLYIIFHCFDISFDGFGFVLAVTCPWPLIWAQVPIDTSYTSSLFKIWTFFFLEQHQFLQSKQYKDAMIHVLWNLNVLPLRSIYAACVKALFMLKCYEKLFLKDLSLDSVHRDGNGSCLFVCVMFHEAYAQK